MTALLVPVQLDALVVRQGGDAWAKTALAEPRPIAGRRRRQKLLPDPFQDLDPPRPPGVYLHWALPDGLTRGQAAEGREAEFPPVPNRWLVLRLSGSAADGPRAVSGWLLPDANAGVPARLDAFAGEPLPPPGEAPALPLTALGTGDLAWSGYFDNVADRFALHDDLAGVDSGPLAYLVCGWYTEAEHEPIAAATEAGFLDRLEELGWSLDPAQLEPGAAYPTSSLYHGLAVSIGWPEQSWPGDGGALGKELDARPDPHAIEAAVGQNLAEALAALAAAPEDGDVVALLLEGLFAGALPDLAHADGPVRLDADLHQARFGAAPAEAGTESIWQGADAAPEPPPAPEPGPPEAGADAGPGGLPEALAASGGTPAEPALELGLGSFVEVRRSRPRVWHALDPAIALRGAGRSFKHGGDGRFAGDGRLPCRVEGRTVTAFGVAGGDPGSGAAVLPEDPLAAVEEAYGVPPACARLLVELACLDPGSAPDLAEATPAEPSPVAAARARWWTSFRPDAEPAGALQGAFVAGVLPSPVAVTPPTRPWTPLHLEWSAEYLSSPRGAHDWRLGELDYGVQEGSTRPPADPDHRLEGRVLLSASAAPVLESAVRSLEAEAAGAGGAVVDALGAAADATGETRPLAETLADQDLLAGELEGIMEQLRKDPGGAIVQDPETPGEGDLPLGRRPAGFLALRAGFLKPDRIRVVDAYGQQVQLLPGDLEVKPGLGMAVPGEGDLLALAPRFTAPGRVLLRYAAATGARADADRGLSPVCGYLVAGPLDGTLQFFDADGIGLGRLRPDRRVGTAWEEDPGQPAALGALPSRWIVNPFLAALADNVLAADTAAAHRASSGEPAGRRTALASLLRALDLTRRTVDLTGRAGDEHLALLLGQPVAVLRATLMFEVQDPRRPPENAETAIQVRLGALGQANDGLLAYVVDDDFTRVHLVDPAVAGQPGEDGDAEPLDSPFLDTSGVFEVNPGRPVPLTLLVAPGNDVHVTTGLVPRKGIGMLREWVAPALSRLSPTLRFGPVLRDAEATRLPVPSDVRGTWRLHRRPDPLTWESEEVVPASDAAVIGDGPALAEDGWLQVELAPDTLYRRTAVPVQISCVRRFRGGIVAVGGANPTGGRFLIPVAEAVELQESGRFAFFVQEEGAARAEVRVVRTARGTRYLRTVPDERRRNNLGNLPDCPRGEV